jgi:hypothetical protein
VTMAGLLVTRRKVVDRSQLHGAFSGRRSLGFEDFAVPFRRMTYNHGPGRAGPAGA